MCENSGTDFGDEEFDTIGGLVIQAFGHMPGRNEVTRIDDYEFMVINAYQRKHVLLKLHELLDGLKDRTIALLGLAFKQDTDDMREAPSINLVEAVCDAGGRVRAHDPEAADERRIVHRIRSGIGDGLDEDGAGLVGDLRLDRVVIVAVGPFDMPVELLEGVVELVDRFSKICPFAVEEEIFFVAPYFENRVV